MNFISLDKILRGVSKCRQAANIPKFKLRQVSSHLALYNEFYFIRVTIKLKFCNAEERSF